MLKEHTLAVSDKAHGLSQYEVYHEGTNVVSWQRDTSLQETQCPNWIASTMLSNAH